MTDLNSTDPDTMEARVQARLAAEVNRRTSEVEASLAANAAEGVAIAEASAGNQAAKRYLPRSSDAPEPTVTSSDATQDDINAAEGEAIGRLLKGGI